MQQASLEAKAHKKGREQRSRSPNRAAAGGAACAAVSLQEEYDAALELIGCLQEACPRSAAPHKVEVVVRQLLHRAGLRDTAAEMRARVTDLAQDTEYIRVLARARQALKAHNMWREEIDGLLAEAQIDWRGQDAERASLASSLGRGWRGIAFSDLLLGCGIGDAFGAGIEFWDGQWIHANVDGSAFVLQRGDPVLNFAFRGSAVLKPDQAGSGQNYLPGMYTDDCEMTVGLMHALMAPSTYPPTKETMLRYWQDEYFKGQAHYLHTRFWALAGVGRNGHGGIANVYSGSCTIEDLCELQRKKQYPGNAPPMRALPLAFIKDDSLMIQLAIANADATHPHPKARASSLGIALGAQYYVIEQREPSGIITWVLKRLQGCSLQRPGVSEVLELDPQTMSYLAEVDALPGPGRLDAGYQDFMADSTLICLCGPQPVWQGKEVKPLDGSPRLVRGLGADAQRTLGCVLYMLKHHVAGMQLQTLLRCVCVGGDVDSLAALCLAMVGGREGLRFDAPGVPPGGLPMYMLKQLEAAEYLTQVASEFDIWVCKHHDD